MEISVVENCVCHGNLTLHIIYHLNHGPVISYFIFLNYSFTSKCGSVSLVSEKA